MSYPKQITLSALLALTLAASAFAMSGDGCGGDCTTCHAISVEEATGILKGVGTVKAIKPAPVRGLYEITLDQGGEVGVAYMDYGKKHLIAGPVFEIASRQAVGAPAAAKRLERLDPATLKTGDSLMLGNPKGKKRLFVFTDPECPFCARMHVELKKLVALEPDLAVFIKLYPLKMHPKAYDKARVILGANSLHLLEKSFAGEALPAPGANDPKKPVDDTLRFAKSVGIDSTPTLVLPDGRIMPGFKNAAAMQKML